MSEGSHLVEVRELCKYFPVSGRRLLKAVDGVTFGIRRGEVLGLVGESGCGKTTIGRLILNLLPPTAGMISFGGVKPQKLKKAQLRRMRRRRKSFFQSR